MIKFFRKIRQNLLNEGKTTKYFKYAVGEIVLVVIGILIALWINQRASYNKERHSEIAILKEIQSNLERDLTEIDEDIAFMDTVNEGSHFIVHYLEHFDKPNSEFNHNVLKLRTTPHLNPNTSGYRLLVSKGVEIIQNNSLRQAISDHYESYYPYYQKYEQERIEFRIKYIESEQLKYFSWQETEDPLWLGEYQINEEDYTLLKNEGTFYKLAQATKRENNLVQNRALRIKQNMIDLLYLLNKEISTKN